MPQYAFELLAQGQAIPLGAGVTLTRDQFPMLQPATPGGPVAQVNANPSNPSEAGLQNLSSEVWTVWMPDGTQQQAGPGQMVPLMNGQTLQLGTLRCSVRGLSSAGAGQSYSQPPISQQPYGQQPYAPPPISQPPPPYYQQSAPQQAPTTWPPAPNPYGDGGMGFNNTSGTGANAVLPAELKGFNGGALLLNWIWALNMKSYLGLLCLIPYLGWIMAIVLGVKGNEWAWQNRRWNSIEEFKTVQKIWLNWGLAIFVGSLVVGFAAGFLEGMMKGH